MAVMFDTLKFVQTLEEAGGERKQASAIATAVRDSHDAAELATKGDLEAARRDLDTKIELLRHDLETKTELLRRDLIIKLGTMQIVGFGTVIGLLLKIMG